MTWVFSCKLAVYFQNIFSWEQCRELLLNRQRWPWPFLVFVEICNIRSQIHLNEYILFVECFNLFWFNVKLLSEFPALLPPTCFSICLALWFVYIFNGLFHSDQPQNEIFYLIFFYRGNKLNYWSHVNTFLRILNRSFSASKKSRRFK